METGLQQSRLLPTQTRVLSDVGWLPINVPFPFDVFEGDPYDLYPCAYTLVPVLASLRWQLGNGGRRFCEATGSHVHRIRYCNSEGPGNTLFFVRHGSEAEFHPPELEGRAVARASSTLRDRRAVYYAQGQNFTFNINMGVGCATTSTLVMQFPPAELDAPIERQPDRPRNIQIMASTQAP